MSRMAGHANNRREKTALITEIAGQDGSLLAELLLSKGCTIYGTVRTLSFDNLSRMSHLLTQVQLVAGDLLDQNSLVLMLEEAQPDEVYNLAAPSASPGCWKRSGRSTPKPGSFRRRRPSCSASPRKCRSGKRRFCTRAPLMASPRCMPTG